MTAEPTAFFATPLASAVARFTSAALSFAPGSLALFVLRPTLARPFFASGLTRWDGWFTLSFGTKVLFSDEYRLQILGAEIPFPIPENRRRGDELGRDCSAHLRRPWFAYPLRSARASVNDAVIQLVYPDGWQNFHLPWPAVAFEIMAFGPGALSLDRVLGIDGVFPRRTSA
jgi:putative oxidoreductase